MLLYPMSVSKYAEDPLRQPQATKRVDCICLTNRPHCELAFEGTQRFFLTGQSGAPISVDVSYSEMEEAFVSTFTEIGDNQRNIDCSQIANLMQQSTNLACFQVGKELDDASSYALLSDVEIDGPSAYRVELQLDISNLSDLADFCAYYQRIQHFDQIAKQHRRRWAHWFGAVQSHIESKSTLELLDLAKATHLHPYMHLPVEVNAGSRRVFGALTLADIDGLTATGNLILAVDEVSALQDARVTRTVVTKVGSIPNTIFRNVGVVRKAARVL